MITNLLAILSNIYILIDILALSFSKLHATGGSERGSRGGGGRRGRDAEDEDPVDAFGRSRQ